MLTHTFFGSNWGQGYLATLVTLQNCKEKFRNLMLFYQTKLTTRAAILFFGGGDNFWAAFWEISGNLLGNLEQLAENPTPDCPPLQAKNKNTERAPTSPNPSGHSKDVASTRHGSSYFFLLNCFRLNKFSLRFRKQSGKFGLKFKRSLTLLFMMENRIINILAHVTLSHRSILFA